MRLLLAVLVLATCTARTTLPEKQRGMSYACAREVRYGSPGSAESLRELKSHGVNWITIMPFGFHRGTAEIRYGGSRVWETDESLAAVTKQAHELGIRVMLKPHIWGRGELKMSEWSDAEWRMWFDAYTRFIEHYATIARDAGADAFCVGNEQKVASMHDAEWRRIITRVRSIFRGPITYGANFDEVFDVPFWDAVDWIGVSAYFPLVEERSPSRESLVRAWQPIVARLERLSKESRRPIVFTELGYRSADRAAWRQWELPRHAPVNLDAQRAAYEAFFEAVWPQPWLAGAYPWKWESYPNHSGPESSDYHVDNKPAEEVVRRYYRGEQDGASAREFHGSAAFEEQLFDLAGEGRQQRR